MAKYRFGACEWNYPIWGSLALEMARDQGYEGIEITDGGGYLHPHPMNKGYFVEVERLLPNKIRQDAVPLSHPFIQDDYLEAQARTGIRITGIYLYFLNDQGFVSADNDTLTGKDCLETIKNAVIAADKMGIPQVSVPTKGMFGTAKLKNAYEKLKYAVQLGDEYGIRIINSFDTSLERELEVLDLLGGKLKVDMNTLDPEIYNRGTAADMIRAFGADRIGQVKIRAMVPDREGFLTRATGGDCLIGQGGSGWRDAVKALKETGYEGWVLTDSPFNSYYLNVDGQTYDSLAKKDLETLKNAFMGGEDHAE